MLYFVGNLTCFKKKRWFCHFGQDFFLNDFFWRAVVLMAWRSNELHWTHQPNTIVLMAWWRMMSPLPCAAGPLLSLNLQNAAALQDECPVLHWHCWAHKNTRTVLGGSERASVRVCACVCCMTMTTMPVSSMNHQRSSSSSSSSSSCCWHLWDTARQSKLQWRPWHYFVCVVNSLLLLLAVVWMDCSRRHGHCMLTSWQHITVARTFTIQFTPG